MTPPADVVNERATLDEYRTFIELSDRVEAGIATPAEQARVTSLAATNPYCRREVELLGELSLPESSLGHNANEDAIANAVAMDAVLRTMKAPSSVVALRPGTAPPAREGAVRQTDHGRQRWVFAGSALVAGAALAAGAFVWMTPTLTPLEHGPAEDVNSGARDEVTANVADATAGQWLLVSGTVVVSGAPNAVAGGVEVAAEQTPVAGDAVASKSRVRVEVGRACVLIPTQVVACFGDGSDVTLPTENDPHAVLVVTRGTVVATLSPRKEGQSFSLASAHLRARAIGTVFALNATEDDSSVHVVDGRVHVVESEGTGAKTYEVDPGQVFRRGSIESTSVDARRELGALLAGIPSSTSIQPNPSAGVSILTVESEPAGAFVTVNDVPVGRSPLSWIVPSTSQQRQVSLELEGYQREGRTLKLAETGMHRLFFDLERIDDRKKASVSGDKRVEGGAAPSAESPAELLSRARHLVREGRWSSAAAAYRQLRSSHPGSPEAKTVLVALAQLQLDRLGDPASALTSYRTYLRSGGPLTQEAHAGSVRALRALGRSSEELSAIRGYLAAYPNGLDAASFDRRKQELEAP